MQLSMTARDIVLRGQWEHRVACASGAVCCSVIGVLSGVWGCSYWYTVHGRQRS